MPADIRVNPFMDRGQWFWRNAEQRVNGPYRTQVEALGALLRHCDPRNKWQRLWAAVMEFIRS